MTERDKVDNRIQYWIDRMRSDSARLTDEQKTQLTVEFLRNFCHLSQEELDVFSRQEIASIEEMFAFAAVEGKVGQSYGGSNEDEEVISRAGENYEKSFREIMNEMYTEAELDEIVSYIGEPQEVGWATLKLFFTDGHWLATRVRNAYLPLITDVIRIGPNGGTDITDQFFDGPDDAATQIDGLMGE